MLPFKTAEKLIFSPVKIDRILVPHCYSHNRAHQASVVLLPLELFSIQAHVISRDLHFFEGNNFHESVFKALCQKAATIQNSLLFIWFLSNGFLMDFFFWRGGGFERLSEQSIENVRYSASWFLSVGNAVSMHQNNSLHPVWLVIFYVRSACWGFAYYPLETLLSSGQPHVSKKAECDMEKTYAAKWEGGIPWESGNEGSGGQMQSQIFLPWGDFACS